MDRKQLSDFLDDPTVAKPDHVQPADFRNSDQACYLARCLRLTPLQRGLAKRHDVPERLDVYLRRNENSGRGARTRLALAE